MNREQEGAVRFGLEKGWRNLLVGLQILVMGRKHVFEVKNQKQMGKKHTREATISDGQGEGQKIGETR